MYTDLMTQLTEEEERKMEGPTPTRTPLRDVVVSVVRKRKRSGRSSTPPPRGKVTTRKALRVPKTKLERERNKMKLIYPKTIVIVKIGMCYEIYDDDALHVVEKTNLTLQDPSSPTRRFKHHTSFHESRLSSYLVSFSNLGIDYKFLHY